MKELIEYRTSLIDRLVAAAGEFRAECLAVREPFTPLEPGGWNTHQMAVHTRDVGRLVYRARVRTTAEELDPEFENFDGEIYMTEHYSAGEPLEDIFNSLVEEAGSLAGLLRALPTQAWLGPHQCAVITGLARAGINALVEHAADKSPRGRTGRLCDNPQIVGVNLFCFEYHAVPPKYTFWTSSLSRTSCGVPSAMSLPW